MEAADLQQMRKSIDELDREIIVLLSERFKVTEQVGIYKANHHLDVQDQARETEQFKKITELSIRHGLRPEYALEIYRRIIDLVISRHEEIKKETS